MLPAPAHGHARDRLTGAEKGTVRILFAAATGYQLLHDDLAVTNDVRGPAECGGQLNAVIRAPGLHASRIEEVLLDGGLEARGPIKRKSSHIRIRAREPGQGYRNRQALREPVCLPLVPDVPDGGRAGRGYPEVPREHVAVRGQRRDVLVPGRIENPSG